MHTLSWNGLDLHLQSHNVQVGSHQLELRRCYRDAKGTPVLLVPGFLETTQIFLPGKDHTGGLAPFLAAQGYDVYLLELRGKGGSWPRTNSNAEWGLHQAVCEDIPAHLVAIEKLRPGVPQFWVGQGLGSLLLLGAYARIKNLYTPLLGIAHFSPARRLHPATRRQTFEYKLFNLTASLSCLFRGFATRPFADTAARESAGAYQGWRQWRNDGHWLDPEDQFDYGAALAAIDLPPSLYLANQQASVWGNVQDCRRWLGELGPHDACLMVIGKAGGNQQNYSGNGLLRHAASCEDHFLQLQDWMRSLEQPTIANAVHA